MTVGVGLVRNAAGKVLVDDPKNADPHVLALVRERCKPEDVICKNEDDKKFIWPELPSTTD